LQKRAKRLLESFLAEDIGKGDITSKLLSKKKISANIVSRQQGILAGVKYAEEIFVSRQCRVRILKSDGQKIKKNEKIMIISGQAYSILSCERTVLNLLSRMSGIATQTNMLARMIKKTNPHVELYSTRKTAPGLRFFDKEAVEVGGGNKHRMSLDQMIMIKDNHIAVVKSLRELIQLTKKHYKIIEVEVENLNDAITAAIEGATIIMLDNIPPSKIRKIVKVLEKLGLRKKVKLEASGGINISNVKSYAKSGVDMISIGKLTSSVSGLDLSLEV